MNQMIGESFLWMGFFTGIFSLCLSTLYFLNRKVSLSRKTLLIKLTTHCAFLKTFFVGCAFLILIVAFIQNDFSILYVSQNSHPDLALLYRITAIWGGHEGSILLWILALLLWQLAYLYKEKDPLVIVILNMISLGFLSFLLFTSNPYLSAKVLSHGKDLNPLLQDPGFIFHPPMLYLGYVGFSVTFALTLAKLLRNELNRNWASLTKQFAIAAFSFLTLGILLGSWWSYRVLGWGGYWFWDPVENASLLPWLSGVALIHLLLLVEKSGKTIHWAVILSIITFMLSILGTFLVRSGVLISAHTFASDPARGLAILILLLSLLTFSFSIYCWKAPLIKITTLDFHFSQLESLLMINSWLFFSAMLIVLLGTLYPLILDVFRLGIISVGAPYFNLVMLPILFLILFFMSFVPFAEKQYTWLKILGTIALNLLFTVIILIYAQQLHYFYFIFLGLSIFIIYSLLIFKGSLPMKIGHLGFALMIIGILLSSFLSEETEVLMKPKDTAMLGPYQFQLQNIKDVIGPNYAGVRGNFAIIKNKRHIADLNPEKRIYRVREMVLSKVDIHPGIFRDLYIALGSPIDNLWQIRIYYKPFIRFIWLGGLFICFSGFLSLTQRKFKHEQI